MAEDEKIPNLTPPPPPEIAKLLAGLTFTRSSEYKVVFSNAFRTRVGTGDITLIFSRVTHTPSVAIAGTIIEEQVEIAMSWPQLKQLAMALTSIVNAIEQEVEEIQVPMAFKIDPEAQRVVIRGLGFPSRTKK